MERRLAAILAADMVGYSRLMSADEEGTIARQRNHRQALIDPAIASHGGRIVKTMGDGLLVEFASVVDALRCAVAVQTGMAEREGDVSAERRIQYRVGINLGDIVIDGDDILGDGVNVAARLEGLAEPGGICVSDLVHQSVEGKLDVRFADMGAQRVKNIARPVRVYRVLLSGAADTSAREPAPSDKPSIAVLPFDNLSGDPEQEYFSDGMAEDLITDLSKISNLSVTARNSSFSFKGQMPDVADVAGKLGVAYVLEGSVRKMGDRLRINAQLIDGASGRHIWAERYDGDMAEIFEFQDRIREEIVSALRVSLTPSDRAHAERKPTDSVEAYDLFLKGRADVHRATFEHLLAAINCLEQAIAIDPDFADAYGYLSYCHLLGWGFMLPGFDDGSDRANELAERAVALDGTSANAVLRLGMAQMFVRRFDPAVANLEKAIALAPNNAEAYATLGQMLNYWGDPRRALELIETAFSLETFPPATWEHYAAHSHFLLRQYDRALARYLRSIERGPTITPAHWQLACLYVELDRIEDARRTLEKVLEITPRYTLTEFAQIWPYRRDEDRDRILDGLRKAGLPEGGEGKGEASPLSDKPSIAVLPFDNLSGDPEQEYFSDGMAEDLITDLSKISTLSVAARNSSFSFKGQMPDVADVAAKLGVAFVLEGSVRKMGDRLRINAQLIDGASGRHIWAERYDGDMAEIFEFQDRIREEIVSALRVSLTASDKVLAERKPTQSVEAYDLFLRGRSDFYNVTHDNLREAVKLLEQAIEIDPAFAEAYSYLAFCHFAGYVFMVPGFDDTLDRALQIAEKGVALDRESGIAVARLGYIQMFMGQFDQAIANLEKAVALAPASGEVCATSAQILNYWGDPERALKLIEKAFNLETFVPALWEFIRGLSHLLLRDYDEALFRLRRAVEQAPKFIHGYTYLTYVYVELGRLDDAKAALDRLLDNAPRFSLKVAERMFPYRRDEDLNRILEGLRKAGLPEG